MNAGPGLAVATRPKRGRALLRVVVSMLAGAAALAGLLMLRPAWLETLRWRGDQWFARVPAVQTYYEKTLAAIWRRGAELTPPGTTLLLGDSHLQGLPAAALHTPSLNLAIGGITSERLAGMLQRRELSLPARPVRIVLLIGHNDLATGVAAQVSDYAVGQLLEQLSSLAPVLLLELVPRAVDTPLPQPAQAQIDFNASLKARCSQRPACQWLASDVLKDEQGLLRAEFTDRDRIHLSEQGMKALRDLLDFELARPQPEARP